MMQDEDETLSPGGETTATTTTTSTTGGGSAAAVAAAAAATLAKYQRPDVEEISAEESRRAWSAVRDDTDESYAETAVENASVPCTLEHFFDVFVRDESSYPLSSYMRDVIGDTNIEVSPWTTSSEDNDGASLCLTRTIDYTHPVNAGPMAPPEASASRSQTLCLYGGLSDGLAGLVLDTRTTVRDVPVSDCFHVDDRLILEPNPDGDTVNMTAKYEVRFVKRTMFKKIVRMTTGDEVAKFWKQYESFCREALGEKREEEPSMLDQFMHGLEEVANNVAETANEVAETVSRPFQEMAEEMERVADQLLDAACAAVGIPTAADAVKRDVAKQTMQAIKDDSDSDDDSESGEVELTYLPGLQNQLDGAASSSAEAAEASYAEHAARALIRSALLRKIRLGDGSAWEKIRGETYASPEWKVRRQQQGEDSAALLGYAAFEDAVVAALLSSSEDEDEHDEEERVQNNVEVALFPAPKEEGGVPPAKAGRASSRPLSLVAQRGRPSSRRGKRSEGHREKVRRHNKMIAAVSKKWLKKSKSGSSSGKQ